MWKSQIYKDLLKKVKWFMNSETFLDIDLLKDNMGRGLLQPNPTSKIDYILLVFQLF